MSSMDSDGFSALAQERTLKQLPVLNFHIGLLVCCEPIKLLGHLLVNIFVCLFGLLT